MARKSRKFKKFVRPTGCPICGAPMGKQSGLPMCERGHRITLMEEDWAGKIQGHKQPKPTEARPIVINPQRKRNPLKFEE
jgi:hypothetical protein